MSTNLLSVEITQEKQDAVTLLLDNLLAELAFLGDLSAKGRQRFVKMGCSNVDQAPGSFSHEKGIHYTCHRLFPERCRVNCGVVSGYLWKGVRSFREMRHDICTNAVPHLWECPTAFTEMVCRIWGNVPTHLLKWCAALGEMTARIWGNVPPHLLKWYAALGEMTERIWRNVPVHLPEWYVAFREMTGRIWGNVPPHLWK